MRSVRGGAAFHPARLASKTLGFEETIITGLKPGVNRRARLNHRAFNATSLADKSRTFGSPPSPTKTSPHD